MQDEPSAAPSMALRPYQEQARNAVRARYQSGQRAALIVLPTGTGKTFTALSMISATVRAGKRVLWLAHRTELIDQPLSTWRALPALADSGRAGAVKAERDEADAALVCASVQTLARPERLERVLSHGLPAVVVVDEAHHAAAGQWRGILDAIDARAEAEGAKKPWWLGLTATPERADRASLAKAWGDGAAFVYTYDEAIRDGYLVEPRFLVDRLIMDDETEELIRTASAKEDDAELARLLLLAGIAEHTVTSMGEHARGRRALVFTASVEQAEITTEKLRTDGWRAHTIHAGSRADDRAAVLRGFQAGEVDAICNCAVLTEGTDLPSCDCIVAARPFSSKPLWVQSVGRGLRLYPGKAECLVLDLGGASLEHTMVMAAALLETTRSRKPFKGRVMRRLKCAPIGARVIVEPDGADGWVVVALLIGETEERIGVDPPEPVEVPGDVKRETDGEPCPNIPGMWRARSHVLAEWADLNHGSAWACDCGQHGMVFLVEVEPGGWMTYLLPKRARSPRPLGRAPCGMEFARALGDDLFRQAAGLVARNASWREKPASDGQIGYAARLGIDASQMTQGQAAGAICRVKGRAALSRIGIEKFKAAIG